MKKYYFVLTSVLALTACGWGGGGHSGSGVAAPRAAVSDAAIESNRHITSMASEVLVQTGSGEIVPRRSGSVNYDGKTYTSYRLDDVNFRVATGTSNDAFLNFKMDDNGRIDSLVMNVGSADQKMFRRDDVSADFRGIVYEYVLLDNTATADDANDNVLKSDEETLVRLVYSPENDPASFSALSSAAAGKCPNGRVCRWDRIDQAFRVTSKGNGLTYSDFGQLQTANFGKYKGVTADNFANSKQGTRETHNGEIQTGEYSTWNNIVFDEDDYEVFGGGYKVSALSHRPNTDMHFTGKAIGSVYATDSSTHPDNAKALEDTAATLDFVDGVETLTMNFNNDASKWYKVVVTKEGGNVNNIMFSDFNASGDDGTRFREETDGVLSVNNFNATVGSAEENGAVKREGLLDMGYYGMTGPEEATGVVRYKEISKEDGIKYEREFHAGYGMKPTE